MNFRFQPVQSFEDAQGNFEQLEGKNILDLVSGSGIVTWTSGVNRYTPVVTVTHGLGRIPTAILLGQHDTVGGFNPSPVVTGAPTTTTFGLYAYATDGQPPVNDTARFYWAVIG